MPANTARALAWISAVFCGAAACLLAWDWYLAASHDPLHSERAAHLAALVRQHLASPQDTHLKAEILRFDQEMRQVYFDAQSRRRIGCGLLALGLTICAAAARRSLWSAPPPGAGSSLPWRNAGRLTLLLSAIALLALAASVAISSPARPLLAIGEKGQPASGHAGAAGSQATLAHDPAPWPAFRGPDGSGVCAFADIPDKWDEESGLNILWKVPVPLPGLSSAIRWGDRIFVTGATRAEHALYCFAADTGHLLWTATHRPGPEAATDYPVYEALADHLHAAATPTTDGKSVFALYGTGELIAFDAATGNIRWQRLLAGTRGNPYGIASSPILVDGLLIVLLDSDKKLIFAIDPATGSDKWQRERVDKTWATPLALRRDNSIQLIINASPGISGWSLPGGELRWRAQLLSGDIASSPIAVGNTIIACGGSHGIFAIDANSHGDIGENPLWQGEALTKGYITEVISPISDGERVWLHCGQALACFDARSGRLIYEEEMPENCVYASPVLAGSRLYVFGEKTTFVIAASAEYRLLNTCRLAETFHTCPAFGPGRMWIRAEKSLYCLGQKPSP